MPAGYLVELRDLATAHGITHVGVASAGILTRARAELLRRRDEGLADTMQFTYRQPERSTDPRAAVRGAQSILVAARPYLIEGTDPGPAEAGPTPDADPVGRVARYAWADHYAPLRAGLWAVAHRLRDDGWKAVAYADDNSIVDREVAHLAGLGWFGKSANLLVPGLGSYVVLGCVVTTAPLPVAERVTPDGCGSCRSCLDGCPTGAIVAPGVVDARRCLAWLLQKPGVFDPQWRIALGGRIYGCDDCQEVCPPTVRLAPRRTVAAPGADGLGGALQRDVSVLALLEGTDDEVLATCGRWYLAERDPRWLRRNALVVLGNVADRGDARVRAALARYLAHDDPVLRAHAVWATARLGLAHLLPDHDDHPLVQRELNDLPAPRP